MTTTKKDFERAAMLMKHHPELERAIICDYMLRFFAGSNARFDRSRFIAACGLREDSSGEIVRPRRSVQNDDVVLLTSSSASGWRKRR